jgi:hypothetical protein
MEHRLLLRARDEIKHDFNYKLLSTLGLALNICVDYNYGLYGVIHNHS